MSLQDLLKYQEKDRELYLIEQELNNSDSSKKYKEIGSNKMKLSEEIKNSARKIEDLSFQLDKINREIVVMHKELSDLLDVVDSFQEMREIDLYEKKVFQMTKNIDMQDSELRRISKQMDELSISSKKAVAWMIKFNNEIDSLLKKLEEMKERSLPKRKEITQELRVLEGSISPLLLEKYKIARKNGKMPVVVKLNNFSCGGCNMDVSRDSLNKLDIGIGECSNCGRIIFE